MKDFYNEWNKDGKKIQIIAYSGDKDQAGFDASIKDMPWVQGQFGQDFGGVKAKIPLKHYPLPGIINAKTGDVICENAWGKVEASSLEEWMGKC